MELLNRVNVLVIWGGVLSWDHKIDSSQISGFQCTDVIVETLSLTKSITIKSIGSMLLSKRNDHIVQS